MCEAGLQKRGLLQSTLFIIGPARKRVGTRRGTAGGSANGVFRPMTTPHNKDVTNRTVAQLVFY